MAEDIADVDVPPSASGSSGSGGVHARPTRAHLLTLPAQSRADLLFTNSEILAPMVRASSAPLRLLALEYGADLVYTEEIVDRAITSCDRILNDDVGSIDYVKKPSSFSPKVRRRMRNRNEIPVVLRILPAFESGRLIYQMGTGESSLALPAALRVVKDVDGIDVNMGCPKKFSVSGGMGSALLSDPHRACDVIRTLRRNLGETPVSAKIRLLGDVRSTVEFARGLIGAGANAVAIHARRVGDESTTAARWDDAAEVVRELKRVENVPVILNGDLYARDDMTEMRRRTGCDGVMMARPALYNASLFRKPPPPASASEDDSAPEKYSYSSPLLSSKTSVARRYMSLCHSYGTSFKNAKYVVCEMMNHRRTPPNISYRLSMDFDDGRTVDEVCRTQSTEELCRLWDVNLSGIKGQTVDAGMWLDGKLPGMGNENENENENGTAAVAVAAMGGAVAEAKGEALTSPAAPANAGGGGNGREGTDGRTYDDRYFLDPEGLRRERESKVKDSAKGAEAGAGTKAKAKANSSAADVPATDVRAVAKDVEAEAKTAAAVDVSSAVADGGGNDGEEEKKEAHEEEEETKTTTKTTTPAAPSSSRDGTTEENAARRGGGSVEKGQECQSQEGECRGPVGGSDAKRPRLE